MAAELVIKINGDISNFKKSLDDAQKKTEDLSGALSTIAKVSGVAFAGLVAEVGFSVKAFAEGEEASNQLSRSLANQGLLSKELVEDYQAQAQAMREVTGASDDAILRGQAVAQGYLGQIKITKDLTQAVVDFATAQKMDVESAFAMVAKSIGTQTNALARSGIVVNEYATKQEKMAQVIAQLTARFGGQAAAATEGLGVFKLLGANIEDLQKAIGARFAPAVEAAGRALNYVVTTLKNNKAAVDFAASMLAAGVAVTGLVSAISAAEIGFIAFKAALTAAGVATTATKVAIQGLIGATGIGLLVVAITEAALNWNIVWPQMAGVFKGFIEYISELAKAGMDIFKGLFTLDMDLFEQGIREASESFSKGFDEYKATVKAKKEEMHQEELADDARRKAEMDAQNQAHAQVVLSQDQQVKAEMARMRDAENKKRISDQAKANLEYEKNEKIFGKDIAELARWMNTEKVQKFKDATGELTAMQTSNNATLKSIGKAAAIADITMRTPVAAMRIYEGFATIPIVGPALGIAGAAAAIAFGAEQMGRVLAAADGGLVTGGIPGQDSVRALLMPGELVVPTQNFEEVISAVAQQRNGEGSGGTVEVVLKLKDNLMDFIETSMVERRNLNLSIVGA